MNKLAKPPTIRNCDESRHKLIGLQALVRSPAFYLSDCKGQPLPGREDFMLNWTGRYLEVRFVNEAGLFGCDVELNLGADWRQQLYNRLGDAYNQLAQRFMAPEPLVEVTLFRELLFAPRRV